jgi:membrane-bound lytic murein transglycosylase F
MLNKLFIFKPILKMLLIVCCLLALIATQTNAISAATTAKKNSKTWTKKYDRHFKKYSKRYFGPLFNWHWFKAQAIAESGLSHQAKSHVGARGLMQIMPATLKEITHKNPHFSQLDSVKWNIAAGIYYDRTLYIKFKKASPEDKLYMTFASYNAGYYRIFKARKKITKKKQQWLQIKKYLPKETRGYVKRIKQLKVALETL